MSVDSFPRLRGQTGRYSGLPISATVPANYYPVAIQSQQGSAQGDTRSGELVYDMSTYGTDLIILLNTPDLTAQAITYSTSTFQRAADATFTPDGGGSKSYQNLVHSVEHIYSNTDSGFLMHLGNNTAFNENYLFEADMTAAVHQLNLCMAVALNCSAYTSGSLNLNSVTLTLKTYQGTAQLDPYSPYGSAVISAQTAFTALTGTGTQIMPIKMTLPVDDFRLWQQQPLTVNITLNTTISGTNTSQVGILDAFPLFATNGPRMLYPSQLMTHIHTLPEHVNTLQNKTAFKLVGPPV